MYSSVQGCLVSQLSTEAGSSWAAGAVLVFGMSWDFGIKTSFLRLGHVRFELTILSLNGMLQNSPSTLPSSSRHWPSNNHHAFSIRRFDGELQERKT